MLNQLEKKSLEDLHRLRGIEARIEQNQVAGDALDVVIESIPDQHTLGPFAGIVNSDSFRLTNNDVEFGYLLKQPIEGPVVLSEAYVLQMRELPAVQTMATAVQTGSPDLVFVVLGRIAHWIEANGYRIAGPYRELGLELFKKRASDEMLIEIHMPVESMSPSTDTHLTSGT